MLRQGKLNGWKYFGGVLLVSADLLTTFAVLAEGFPLFHLIADVRVFEEK
jgi:hypothetical protein